MKIVYKGKFNGDMDSLPYREHVPGAVKFKEFDDIKKLGKFMTKVSLVMTVVLFVFVIVWARVWGNGFDMSFTGIIFALLSLLPHELLHAICFKEEAHIYTNLKQGMMFVVGNEAMSKGRYIFMSLLPNIVFGLVPLVLFLFMPSNMFLGTLGALSLPMGVGDYYNIYNAATQMPKGARTYLHKFNSYWFMP